MKRRVVEHNVSGPWPTTVAWIRSASAAIERPNRLINRSSSGLKPLVSVEVPARGSSGDLYRGKDVRAVGSWRISGLRRMSDALKKQREKFLQRQRNAVNILAKIKDSRESARAAASNRIKINISKVLDSDARCPIFLLFPT